MIELMNVSKEFEGNRLYDNFSLKIDDGEFVMVTGASGCGKTTLLNMIGAIEPPDSGTILVDSVDITKKKNQMPYLQQKVGFLFQNFALVENKTVSENLKIVRGAAKNAVPMEEALRRVGLEGRENTKIYKLSGGEQQRVAVARLMIKKGSIVLADEPTGSVDHKNGEQIMKLLEELHGEGKTILMVTHDLSLTHYATRVIELGK
ncbi:MAG: ABC transporter ATP-binding protein [Lachnospiraceae bacterium]|nr:ABC transporter ATP-binding protein [Lachnospiraceae bacterium]